MFSFFSLPQNFKHFVNESHIDGKFFNLLQIMFYFLQRWGCGSAAARDSPTSDSDRITTSPDYKSVKFEGLNS